MSPTKPASSEPTDKKAELGGDKTGAKGDVPAKGASSTGEAVKGPQTSTTAQPVKRPLGVKEVIPFAWKLIGSTPGVVVTLFKSTEREEVEAQHARVLKDGYYSDLQVVDIDFKVVQPKPPKPKTAPKRKKPKTAAKSKSTAKAKVGRKDKTTPKAAPSAKTRKTSAAGAAKRQAKTATKKVTRTTKTAVKAGAIHISSKSASTKTASKAKAAKTPAKRKTKKKS